MKMKKSGKIALIIVSVILIAIIITASVCASIAGKVFDDTAPSEALSHWMSFVKDETLLKRVAIPGSHDSGTKDMPWYSRTQDKSVAEQLRMGIRYFDLRVKIKDGACRIYHGPAYGFYLKDIFGEINAFLDENPSECILLDFQKIYNPEAAEKTCELAESMLGDRIVYNNSELSDVEFINSLSLGETRGKCVLFASLNKGSYVFANGFFIRNNDECTESDRCLQSYYVKKYNMYYSSEKYIEKAIPEYIERYKACDNGIFVLQGQLTDGCFVFGPRFREGGHFENMTEYTLKLADNEDLRYINVVMRDFVTPQKACAVLSLNLKKGNIIEDEASAFTHIVEEYIK